LFFSLKGWDNIAQGNALGKSIVRTIQPEGLGQSTVSLFCPSPSGWNIQKFMRPRALPWAMLSQPFRLKNKAQFPQDFNRT
jgi:hypothetical protein